jgi:hypothetical protein
MKKIIKGVWVASLYAGWYHTMFNPVMEYRGIGTSYLMANVLGYLSLESLRKHRDNKSMGPKEQWIYKVYVRAVYLKRSLFKIGKVHLFDYCYWGKRKWKIINGATAPYWKLMDIETRVTMDVHQKDFKLENLIFRIWKDFQYDYTFWMQNWYSIDVRNKGRFIFDGKKWKDI